MTWIFDMSWNLIVLNLFVVLDHIVRHGRYYIWEWEYAQTAYKLIVKVGIDIGVGE